MFERIMKITGKDAGATFVAGMKEDKDDPAGSGEGEKKGK